MVLIPSLMVLSRELIRNSGRTPWAFLPRFWARTIVTESILSNQKHWSGRARRTWAALKLGKYLGHCLLFDVGMLAHVFSKTSIDNQEWYWWYETSVDRVECVTIPACAAYGPSSSFNSSFVGRTTIMPYTLTLSYMRIAALWCFRPSMGSVWV